VQATDPSLALDVAQLKDVTLNDEELMREVIAALIDDTSRQLELLDSAIRQHDPQRCRRLAHYSKGACANVGANRAAGILQKMEQDATQGAFDDCTQDLRQLIAELDHLRQEAAAI